MLDQLQPSQALRVTVSRVPRTQDARQTIARLMRQDPEIRRALRKAQRGRRRNERVKPRAGRVPVVRPSAAKVAKVEPGASWTMSYFPQIADDLRSVSEYLEIKPA